MFTGIVQVLGSVKANSGKRLKISGRTGRLPRGASLAVNGVCLTVVAQKGPVLDFDVSPETLRLTRLGSLRPGDPVNLEPPLKAGDPLGGHWVSGHVDASAAVLARDNEPGGFVRMRFALPKALARFVSLKGSIAVDGVSLTVSKVAAAWFETALIPETLSRTTLGRKTKGDFVHLEVDSLARTLDRLLEARGIK